MQRRQLELIEQQLRLILPDNAKGASAIAIVIGVWRAVAGKGRGGVSCRDKGLAANTRRGCVFHTHTFPFMVKTVWWIVSRSIRFCDRDGVPTSFCFWWLAMRRRIRPELPKEEPNSSAFTSYGSTVGITAENIEYR